MSTNPPTEIREELAELEAHACPPIDGTTPDWPTKLRARAQWIGLDKHNFVYSHHSSHARNLEEARTGKIFDELFREKPDLTGFARRRRLEYKKHHRLKVSEEAFVELVRSATYPIPQNAEPFAEPGPVPDPDYLAEALFCAPTSQSERLRSIITRSKGGSVLVTGYRGTGKSSIVNEAISHLVQYEERESAGAFLLRVLRLGALLAIPLVLLFCGPATAKEYENTPVVAAVATVLVFLFVVLRPDRPRHTVRKWPLWPHVLDDLPRTKRVFHYFARALATVRRIGDRILRTFRPNRPPVGDLRLEHSLRRAVRWVVSSLRLLWLFRYVPVALAFVAVLSLADYAAWTVEPLEGLDVFGDPAPDALGKLLEVTLRLVLLLAPLAMLIQLSRVPKRTEVFGRSQYVPIRVNLSTSRTSQALAEIMIREMYQQSRSQNLPGVSRSLVERAYRRSRGFSKQTEGERRELTISFTGVLKGLLGLVRHRYRETQYEENPYTLHDAQQDIHAILAAAGRVGYKVVFIFDELDKLLPKVDDDYATASRNKRIEVEKIVSDLKFLLTETNAFHIFIAGKDVDDRWKEDQNKGEGLFESIFIQNVYVPSTLSAELHAAIGGHAWLLCEWVHWLERTRTLGPDSDLTPSEDSRAAAARFFEDRFDPRDDMKLIRYLEENEQRFLDGMYEAILRELDVKPIQWTYNTGLIILPHLSEHELRNIILRAARHQIEQDQTEGTAGPDYPRLGAATPEEYVVPYLRYIDRCATSRPREEGTDSGPSFQPAHFSDWLHCHKYSQHVSVATERRCRRLRYVLQYLTFKGRGIPRKILREFYTLVVHRDSHNRPVSYWAERGNPEYVLLIPEPLRQKIKFFATIVSRLEANLDIFRTLDDKGCVALFHIVDYVLKFYQTGFSWSDIENANFMTDREELFPSRELAVVILRLLEDVLIERVERRERVYMLLPRMKHDLKGLYLAFGPEQIELRFTPQEFATEMSVLQRSLDDVKGTTTEARVRTFKTQIRLGKIFEMLGDIPEALLTYSQAIRWIRLDIERLMERKTHGAGEVLLLETALVNYLSFGIEVLHRMGYLYEFQREFDRALHFYQSAANFYEYLHETRARRSVLGPRPSVPWPGRPLSDIDVAIAARGDGPGDQLATHLEPYGYPLTLNLMAIALEKKWHRSASEKFLKHALEHFSRARDYYNAIDQLILIGEIRMRRRDVVGATRAYVRAAEEASRFQSPDPETGTATRPQLQTSSLAKMYEYLGDCYTASGGRSFVPPPELRAARDPDAIRKAVTSAVEKVIKLSDPFDVIEDREDEIFYTRAAHYYGMNGQYLRESDVYVKKLLVRQSRLLELTHDRCESYFSDPREDEERFGDVVRTWCSFWHGAERVLSSLIDIRGFVRRRFAPSSVVDRRRFGRIFTSIGTMMVIAAKRPVGEFYRLETEEPRTPWKAWADGARARYHEALEMRLRDRAGGVQRDDIPFLQERFHKFIEESTDLDEACRRIDRIYGILIDNERYHAQESICEPGSIRPGSLLWRLPSRQWQRLRSRRPNSFLIGDLWYLFEDAERHVWLKFGEAAAQRVTALRRRVRLLYRAEVAYLGAHVSMAINMRDEDTADCCRAIGVMYLLAVKWLFQLRKEWCAPGMPGELEERAAALYGMLHLAAKRFLVSSLDIYRHESEHIRCTRLSQGLTHRALAELMVIRSEVLFFSAMAVPFDELTVPGVGWPMPALRRVMDAQRRHIEDLEVKDCRRQSGEAYRSAIGHILGEMDEYLKRYRFPNDVYFLHHNVMDPKMHHEIALNLRDRAWPFDCELEASRAAEYLRESQRRLSVFQFNAHPRVIDRDEWLQDLRREADLVADVSARPAQLRIRQGGKGMQVVWCGDPGDPVYPDDAEAGCPAALARKRFVRIVDDGLASLGGNTTL